MKNDSMMKHASSVGLTVVVLYVLCLLWRLPMTDSAVINFHLLGLKTAFPGFQGYEAVSMVLGAIWSFIYGFIGSWIFHSLHKNCCEMK